MRRDAWVGALSWWSCQSPVAQSCRLLSHLNSFRGGTFKPNSKFDADSLLYSLILGGFWFYFLFLYFIFFLLVYYSCPNFFTFALLHPSSPPPPTIKSHLVRILPLSTGCSWGPLPEASTPSSTQRVFLSPPEFWTRVSFMFHKAYSLHCINQDQTVVSSIFFHHAL